MLNKTNSSDYEYNHLLGALDQRPLQQLLSDAVRDILQYVLLSLTCETIIIFGVVSNIINIICLIKQGFKDPVNISLLGLAISDLGCLLTTVWSCFILTPALTKADLPFDPAEFQNLTSAWPHSVFSRITSWMTAFITLERCLCIAMPLKVKYVVTPRRVVITIVVLYVIMISSIAPIYVVNRLEMKYVPEKNKTLLVQVYSDDYFIYESITAAINNVCIPFSAFTTVIMCTLILVVKLHMYAKWAKAATQYGKPGAPNRNMKVARMVVMISTLFIACTFPTCAAMIWFILEPRLSLHGQYRNMLIVLLSICAILESVNSSGNIFIYYHASGRYRAVFRKMFCARKSLKR